MHVPRCVAGTQQIPISFGGLFLAINILALAWIRIKRDFHEVKEMGFFSGKLFLHFFCHFTDHTVILAASWGLPSSRLPPFIRPEKPWRKDIHVFGGISMTKFTFPDGKQEVIWSPGMSNTWRKQELHPWTRMPVGLCPCVHLSICGDVHMPLCVCVSVCVCVCVCLSVCLSVCLKRLLSHCLEISFWPQIRNHSGHETWGKCFILLLCFLASKVQGLKQMNPMLFSSMGGAWFKESLGNHSQGSHSHHHRLPTVGKSTLVLYQNGLLFLSSCSQAY